MIERNIQDLYNAALGFLKTSEEGVKNAIANMERVFEEFKAKGSSDKSEQVIRGRELIRDLSLKLEEARDYVAKLGGTQK
ncbi:MAG TPA: hypothetical protein PKE49_05550 [Leptospiraceae bacterium]|jgi:hypothetical protein|nr:hypothetical protein [Leptospirales bacterium]HMU82061.1 hypothetical protein [Leptospiraceae bacterium]HMW58610.1 hypothetical protein [Leptospiraceae bacterium]HMX55967.1 hypothetical protein [Leptospiraceae bacterium]HMY44617.1 hypothetical protein [Leptospiraceae bacterium]